MKKRVKIPLQDVKAMLDLVTKVRDKHLADGDASPLKVMNWAEISPAIDEALQVEERALQLKREKLSLYQQRARALQTAVSIARNSRDILTGVHSDQMKMLGLWGFDVLDNRTTMLPENEDTSAAAA